MAFPLGVSWWEAGRVGPGELVTHLDGVTRVVPAGVLSRSSVLSCIAEAGGNASLPAVTTSEFKCWLHIAKLEAFAEDAADTLNFSTLCTFLKVRCARATCARKCFTERTSFSVHERFRDLLYTSMM